MKAGTGIHLATSADLLKEVSRCTLQTKVLQGWWHQAMAYIPDKQDSVINDLFCAQDTLQLLGFFLVNKIFVKV
jgi:hypothetical protein